MINLQRQRILVVGGGVVGAMLAYRLSEQAQVTLLDKQAPAQGSTGAALGVSMGAISRKTKGRAWAMRQQSMGDFDTLIEALQQCTDQTIAYNRSGIVKLLFEGDDRDRWVTLAQTRREQGWPLMLWDRDELQARCPSISLSSDRFGAVSGAVHSPCDRQVHPQQLTLALLEAARGRGATTRFDAQVKAVDGPGVTLAGGEYLTADWVILTAGLGTAALAAQKTIDIRPVLGQAVEVQLPQPLSSGAFGPVMTGHDIHIVPVNPTDPSEARYWVGATVEFPEGEDEPAAVEAERQAMWAGAIALCPALQQAAIVRHWWGKRPRPYNRPAPIIEVLPESRVVVASGHYRNGVLLAPATARKVLELLDL